MTPEPQIPLSLQIVNLPSPGKPTPDSAPDSLPGSLERILGSGADHRSRPTSQPDREPCSGIRPPIGSLYIHIPFCSHKCHYCDFYSFVDTRDQQEVFTSRLIEEFHWLAASQRVAADGDAERNRPSLSTIFIGGGTPSLLAIKHWRRILATLHNLFDLTPITDPGGVGEWTVECNPESATLELLQSLKAAGVNRISLGAQSFNPVHLKALERTHNPENVARALDLARSAGFERTSIDLIYAIPGQTMDDWRRDLEAALELKTKHISCYNLTYEPNTAMTRRLQAGEFRPIDDETEAHMHELAVELLQRRGLQRYEVSNFAVAGHESRHNLAYWRQEQWLAAGPSASGHAFAGHSRRLGSWRWKNVPRLGDYLASGGYSPIVDCEPPDPNRLLRERLMMGLRLREGIDAQEFLCDLETIAPARAEPLLAEVRRSIDAGWIDAGAIGAGSIGGGAGRAIWRLTDAGFLMCDFVASRLMQAVGQTEP